MKPIASCDTDSDDDWNSFNDAIINNASSMEGNGYHDDLNQPDIIKGMSPISVCCFKNLILFTRN